MKKKILFLSPLPPPEYGSALSSEMCLDILKNSKDFEVQNIKLNYSKKVSDIGKITLNKIKGILRVKKEIKEKIRDFNPHLIYFVPATSGLGLLRDYLFVKEIKKHNKKIIFHVRSRTIKTKKNNKIYKKMFQGEKAIVLSERLIKDITNYIPKKDIFILPNAIKNEITEKEFKKIIEHRKINSQLNILFLSNMEKSKGWFKLLQACKLIDEKRIDFKCNFAGAWPGKKDKEEFDNFVKKNNLQKEINYFGRKTGKYKNKFLERADILVFPTEYKLETFGRVIIEAMMFGLPVIANGIASIPSTIQHNKTGFVLQENIPEEISECIEKLYNNKEQRINMGKQGRQKFLKHYTLDKYKDKFLGVLREV